MEGNDKKLLENLDLTHGEQSKKCSKRDKIHGRITQQRKGSEDISGLLKHLVGLIRVMLHAHAACEVP